MNTLEQCLQKLIEKGTITYQEAVSKASNPKHYCKSRRYGHLRENDTTKQHGHNRKHL